VLILRNEDQLIEGTESTMADNTSVDLARVTGDHPVAASPDLLRAMVQAFAEALMGAEADALCGAPYGQHSDERVNYRNGTGSGGGTPGRAALTWRSPSCGRARISLIGCWSGAAVPSRR
jgi:Transposase, Mutator family